MKQIKTLHLNLEKETLHKLRVYKAENDFRTYSDVLDHLINQT